MIGARTDLLASPRPLVSDEAGALLAAALLAAILARILWGGS